MVNMEKETKTGAALNEDKLKELLASLHRMPSAEAHFEERFLHVFHENVYQAAVCSSVRSRCWENITMFITGYSFVRKSIYAATTASCLAIFGAFFFLANGDPSLAAQANSPVISITSDGLPSFAELEKLTKAPALRLEPHILASFTKLNTNHILAINEKSTRSNFNIQVAPRLQESSYTESSVFVGNQNYLFKDDSDVVTNSKVNSIDLLPVPYSSLLVL